MTYGPPFNSSAPSITLTWTMPSQAASRTVEISYKSTNVPNGYMVVSITPQVKGFNSDLRRTPSGTVRLSCLQNGEYKLEFKAHDANNGDANSSTTFTVNSTEICTPPQSQEKAPPPDACLDNERDAEKNLANAKIGAESRNYEYARQQMAMAVSSRYKMPTNCRNWFTWIESTTADLRSLSMFSTRTGHCKDVRGLVIELQEILAIYPTYQPQPGTIGEMKIQGMKSYIADMLQDHKENCSPRLPNKKRSKP